jgi:hypothetical protein
VIFPDGSGPGMLSDGLGADTTPSW